MGIALGGFEDNLYLLTDFDRVQVTIHNLGHHGDTLIKRHVGDAIGIRVAALHNAERVDRAFAACLFPFGIAETERAQCARVPMRLLAGLAVFHHQPAVFRTFPESLCARFGCWGGNRVWLVNHGHVQTRSRIRVALP